MLVQKCFGVFTCPWNDKYFLKTANIFFQFLASCFTKVLRNTLMANDHLLPFPPKYYNINYTKQRFGNYYHLSWRWTYSNKMYWYTHTHTDTHIYLSICTHTFRFKKSILTRLVCWLWIIKARILQTNPTVPLNLGLFRLVCG